MASKQTTQAVRKMVAAKKAQGTKRKQTTQAARKMVAKEAQATKLRRKLVAMNQRLKLVEKEAKRYENAYMREEARKLANMKLRRQNPTNLKEGEQIKGYFPGKHYIPGVFHAYLLKNKSVVRSNPYVYWYCRPDHSTPTDCLGPMVYARCNSSPMEKMSTVTSSAG